MRVRRAVAVVAAVLVGAMVGGFAAALPAGAVQVAQSTIVSANPADFTPNVLDGQVLAIAQIGNTIVLGGNFTQVQEVGTGKPILTRNNLLAFDATTGTVSTTFVPALDGQVEALLPTGDGTSIYVGGDFTTVNGAAAKSVTRIDVSTGARVAGFKPAKIDGVVKDMRLVHGNLVVAGIFQHVGGIQRGQLASLNPTTGALTSFVSLTFAGPLNGGILKVVKIDVTPDGTRLLAIGNFSTVNGAARSQIFLLNTGGTTATLSTWQTAFFAPTCSPAFDTYMQDLDISPDGTYAVVSTTGGFFGHTSPCDSTSRWDITTAGTNLLPAWRDLTGGDTTYAVAVTGSAVYVGGHFRWENNPFSSNTAGPGAVPREGLAALDPTNGLPLSWDPGRARGVGVFDILATATGLWVGSDTDQVGGETHGRIAFFPLAGGVTPPADLTGYLPEDVYLMGTATSAPGVSPVTYGDTIDRQFWIGPGHVPETTATPALGGTFSTSRGSFLVDSTVYTGRSDGTLEARSFDGTTLGAPVGVNLYAGSFAADIPTVTGIVYANYRIYYTLAGDPNLYTRSFTPQSQVVGAERYVVPETSFDPTQIAGMFLSGSTLYYANSSSGNLFQVTLSGGTVAVPGTVTGPATLADSTIDWRARGAFAWDGEPASRTNTPPTAVATVSCASAVCTFDGSGSFDPDGHLISYVWDFGDGTTGSGPTITHTYVTAGTYSASLTVTDFQHATDSATVPVHPVHSQYAADGPCRIFDTRTGRGTCTGSPVFTHAKVGAGQTLTIKVTGVASIPATATAVAINVTAVDATAPTFIRVAPHGAPPVLASNLNVASSPAVANMVIVPIGTGGAIDFYNASGTVDLVADLAGYYAPTATTDYSTVGPCRLFDTRTGGGVCTGAHAVQLAPLGAGKSMAVQVAGVASIPSTATAVVLNLTGVTASADTFISAYPDGGATPGVSNLNLHNNNALANLAIVPIGADGKVAFYNAKGTVNVVADIAGYFSPTSPAGYTPITPCRIFDTRLGTGSCTSAPTSTPGPLGQNLSMSVKVTGVANIPSTATAVVLNLTAVGATAPTFITVWPHGGTPPLVSNLNVPGKAAIPNLVVVPIGSGGMIDFYNKVGSVNLIADIAGYYSP